MPKRTDANQRTIVNELSVCGLHVTDLHTVGRGCPDILVTGHRRQTGQTEALLVEIKTERGKLTGSEMEFHDSFPPDGPLIIARTAEDVLAWFGLV